MLEQILRIFWHLLMEAVPLFLLGAIIGAALEAWLKPEWITRWIGGGIARSRPRPWPARSCPGAP